MVDKFKYLVSHDEKNGRVWIEEYILEFNVDF